MSRSLIVYIWQNPVDFRGWVTWVQLIAAISYYVAMQLYIVYKNLKYKKKEHYFYVYMISMEYGPARPIMILDFVLSFGEFCGLALGGLEALKFKKIIYVYKIYTCILIKK